MHERSSEYYFHYPAETVNLLSLILIFRNPVTKVILLVEVLTVKPVIAKLDLSGNILSDEVVKQMIHLIKIRPQSEIL